MWLDRGARLLFGDQTLFCRACDFRRVGGYAPRLPIMEDADLCIRLHMAGPGVAASPHHLLSQCLKYLFQVAVVNIASQKGVPKCPVECQRPESSNTAADTCQTQALHIVHAVGKKLARSCYSHVQRDCFCAEAPVRSREAAEAATGAGTHEKHHFLPAWFHRRGKVIMVGLLLPFILPMTESRGAAEGLCLCPIWNARPNRNPYRTDIKQP